jgi:hypothetical protein
MTTSHCKGSSRFEFCETCDEGLFFHPVQIHFVVVVDDN